MRQHVVAVGVAVALLVAWEERRAAACGCFAPPNAATPIVQAGERILFSQDHGVVTAHVQIQYAGEAGDFGWLLPLPSVPDLQLGSDEVFRQLGRVTQPTYTLTYRYDDCGGGGTQTVGCGFGGGGDSASYGGPPQAGTLDAGSGGPLVVQSSIGPYDYAVLRADSDTEMLAWLAANHYFVPAGIENAVQHYIHPGSYFLALKLQSGKASGDVQPIVLKYASDLPMIPIILTSVGATPNMGIQVYMLGAGRAIPRNYLHTVLNDSKLDWVNQVANYAALVTAATLEVPGHHTFVTEYAGPASVMRDQLAPAGRFGVEADLGARPSIDTFIEYLRLTGYGTPVSFSGIRFPTTVTSVLAAYAPMPEVLRSQVSADDFYPNLATWRATSPGAFVGWPASYMGKAMATEIFDRFVEPMREAEKLFTDHATLTRLFTTLSPEDMTRDPVFSWNPSLPAVSRTHSAVLTYHCDGDFPNITSPAELVTEQGFHVSYPRGTGSPPANTSPSSQRIEVLGEEGPATVQTDNTKAIHDFLDKLPGVAAEAGGGGGGCRVAQRSRYGGAAIMALFVLWRLRRRRC